MWARKARRVICNNLSAAHERKNVLQETMKNWFSVPCKWELNEKLVLWLMLPCFTGNIQSEQEFVGTIKLLVYLRLVKHVGRVYPGSNLMWNTVSCLDHNLLYGGHYTHNEQARPQRQTVFNGGRVVSKSNRILSKPPPGLVFEIRRTFVTLHGSWIIKISILKLYTYPSCQAPIESI